MHPILYILYYFFKTLVWLSQRVYYSKITVINKELGQFKTPCIVVSNHPSTLLDPLNAAVEIGTEVYFLANSSLFKNPVAAWLLSRLYCIPIERLKDTNGRPLNNAASFKKSTQHLGQGRCLYIAPEGDSYVQRRVRKIKTGTARIALAAESRHGFRLGLTILPVGLNYSCPPKFRSQLLTIFGTPIRVADFEKDWLEDEQEAVRKLTVLIGEKLSEIVIDTADEEEDKLLEHIEILFQNEQLLPAYGHFLRTKDIQAKLRLLKEEKTDVYEKYKQQIFDYFDKINSLKISDLALVSFHKTIPGLFKLTALFPFFLLGLFAHFLPVFLTGKLTHKLTKDIHWVATYKYLIGLVLYPLFIALQIWAVASFFENTLVVWAYVLSIVPTGLAMEGWLKAWKLWRERRRVGALEERADDLKMVREGLLELWRVF